MLACILQLNWLMSLPCKLEIERSTHTLPHSFHFLFSMAYITMHQPMYSAPMHYHSFLLSLHLRGPSSHAPPFLSFFSFFIATNPPPTCCMLQVLFSPLFQSCSHHHHHHFVPLLILRMLQVLIGNEKPFFFCSFNYTEIKSCRVFKQMHGDREQEQVQHHL